MPNDQISNTLEEKNRSIPAEDPTDSEAQSFDAEAEPLYGALKCYFYTPKRGDIWGAFCFLFNCTTGETIECVFWVTRLLTSPPVDVNIGWREFNKSIPNIGVYEKTMGDKLLTSLLGILSLDLRIELNQNAGLPGQLTALATEIRKTFERTTHYFLEIKIAFERISHHDMAEAGVIPEESPGENAPNNPEKENKETTPDTLLTCLPVIDPARGTPVSELNPGDVLEVKIQGGIGLSELIEPYLYPPGQNAALPVLSIEKKENSDKIYVVLSVNENLKALLVVSKDLRLRTLQRATSQKRTIIINTDTVILWGTFILAMAVILLVFKFLLF